MPLGLPTPAPISLPAPSTSSRSTSSPAPESHADFRLPIIDAQGVRRYIYYAGRTIMVSCAPSTTCRIMLEPGAGVTSVENPSANWHVTPTGGTEAPTVTVVPDLGAPDTGIVIETPQRYYSVILHTETGYPGAVYGYLFAEHGRVQLPSVTPLTLVTPSPSPEDDEHEHEMMAPIAPEPCPDEYGLSAMNAPGYWPHKILVGRSTVALWFSANGVIPAAAVPTTDTPPDQLWLDHLAMIAQAGEIDGEYRVLRVLACYPTIVLYSGTGKNRRAIILRGRPHPKASSAPLSVTTPTPLESTTPSPRVPR